MKRLASSSEYLSPNPLFWAKMRRCFQIVRYRLSDRLLYPSRSSSRTALATTRFSGAQFEIELVDEPMIVLP